MTSLEETNFLQNNKNGKNVLVVVSQSVAPGALKEAEGGQVVGRF